MAPLYLQLTKNVYQVSFSHPKKTHYVAKAKIKSDRVDSETIEDLVRLDVLPSAYMPDPETTMLR
jgi:hypothetical protein